MGQSIFCVNCGSPLSATMRFCPRCGKPNSEQDSSGDGSNDTLTQDTNFDFGRFRYAGFACFAAAGLLTLSCLMPYVVVTTGYGMSVGRNPFQFGYMETMTSQGPMILIAAVFFVFDGLRFLQVILKDRAIGRMFPLLTCLYAFWTVIDAWSTSGWSNSQVASVHLGYGGLFGLAGVVTGLSAIYFQRSADRGKMGAFLRRLKGEN
jgi:zinc-ribbon domain